MFIIRDNIAVVPFAGLVHGLRPPCHGPAIQPGGRPQSHRTRHGPLPEEERAEGPHDTSLLGDSDPTDSSSHAEKFNAAYSATRNSSWRRALGIRQHQVPNQMHSRESPRPSNYLLLRKSLTAWFRNTHYKSGI